MNTMIYSFLLILLLCMPALAEGESGIKDNSFFIEEAYNQGSGEVQHLFTTEINWMKVDEETEQETGFSFSQEWPLFGHAVQGAYGISTDEDVKSFEVGVELRWQWIENEKWAVAPTVEGEAENLGDGNNNERYAFGVGLPVSYIANEKWNLHGNLGVGYSPDPSSKIYTDPCGNCPVVYEDATTFGYGASAIYALRNNFNMMLETFFETEIVSNRFKDASKPTTLGVLSPGFRYAVNFPGDKQWVMGVGVPIGLTDDSSDYGVFLYMSFEHLFM